MERRFICVRASLATLFAIEIDYFYGLFLWFLINLECSETSFIHMCCITFKNR